ncbi:MAG: esterase-like activity of phytase family protein, partial [Halomonas sp.]|nr:esterase-like activity of phytase family protein [Halomonas sp.]
AIENERDEERDDGALPQLPGGYLSLLHLDEQGRPSDCQAPRRIELAGQAAVAGEDPEPEFVDINGANQAALTLQENNHLVVVDLASGELTLSKSAGAIDLSGIPTAEGSLAADGELDDVRREPDAVGWLDESRFVTANEGDYRGGSRSFAIFNRQGEVEYDSGNALERLALEHGSYPAKRAAKKGAEPEGIEVWKARDLFFVGMERAAAVAVYRDRGPGQAPEFVQWLPTGVGPEGLLAIPQRDLFVVAAEEDDAEAGLRSTVSIYRWSDDTKPPALIGSNDNGEPIGFGALSGLAADPDAPGRFWAVSDSVYPDARLYRLDARSQPARITSVTRLKTAEGVATGLDLEGVAPRQAGGVWVASEGKPDAGQPNEVLGVDADGNIVERFALPAAIAERMGRHGFEGVARLPGNDERLAVIFQRSLEGESGQARLGLLSPQTGEWRFAAVALHDPTSPAGGWVGFSEITPLDDGRLALIERDNQGGERASLKRVVAVSLDGVEPVSAGQAPPRIETAPLVDLLPALAADHGWVTDKPEGMAPLADGGLLVVTDNDGVDDSISQTYLIRLVPAGH